MMHGTSLLRLNAPARPEFATALRHAVAAFLAALDLDPDFTEDVLTATGEALANAIEHAYAASDPADIELQAEYLPDTRLSIAVYDRGHFIARARRPNRGFGIRIVNAIATGVRIETDGGTAVHMEFALPASNA